MRDPRRFPSRMDCPTSVDLALLAIAILLFVVCSVEALVRWIVGW